MIRVADVSDVERLCELELELFPDNASNEDWLERELRAPGRRALVIGHPIDAYALLAIEDNVLDVLRLGVTTAMQGRGLGTELLDAALAYGLCTVLMVHKDNTRALHIYRKAGFEIVGHVTSLGAWVLSRPAECTAYP